MSIILFRSNSNKKNINDHSHENWLRKFTGKKVIIYEKPNTGSIILRQMIKIIRLHAFNAIMRNFG